MLGRKKQEGGADTIDGKNAAVAEAIDEMVTQFRSLKRDVREDLCDSGKLAFDRVIDATQKVARVVRGGRDSRPIVEPAPQEKLTQTELRNGRNKVVEWFDEMKAKVKTALEGPMADATSKIFNLQNEFRRKVQNMNISDLR